MKTNEQTVDEHKICLIDLYAGERHSECRFYLSPLVYVPLLFQEEDVVIKSREGDIGGVMAIPTKALLPFTEMDFVRRESGIVDVQFRFSDVKLLEAKDCPFAN